MFYEVEDIITIGGGAEERGVLRHERQRLSRKSFVTLTLEKLSGIYRYETKYFCYFDNNGGNIYPKRNHCIRFWSPISWN